MTQCDYWCLAGKIEWCEVTEQACSCGGKNRNCTLKANKVASPPRDAQVRERQIDAPRVRRRREFDEAA